MHTSKATHGRLAHNQDAGLSIAALGFLLDLQ